MNRQEYIESMLELIIQAESEIERLRLDIDALKQNIYMLIYGENDWGEKID